MCMTVKILKKLKHFEFLFKNRLNESIMCEAFFLGFGKQNTNNFYLKIF